MALDSHLEQIAACGRAIGELEFAPPGIFTNAVLGSHEITALIRDPEPHERSLFSLDPAVGRPQSRPALSVPAPNQQSAVARVLGPDLLSDVRRSTASGTGTRRAINVPVLLNAAEKLCDAYAVPGVRERIRSIRERHQRIAASVQEYEEKVQQQQSKLNQLNLNQQNQNIQNQLRGNDNDAQYDIATTDVDLDIGALEAEVAELETRKRLLEERVAKKEKELQADVQ